MPKGDCKLPCVTNIPCGGPSEATTFRGSEVLFFLMKNIAAVETKNINILILENKIVYSEYPFMYNHSCTDKVHFLPSCIVL